MGISTSHTPKICHNYYRKLRGYGLSSLKVKHEWEKLHEEIDGGTGDNILAKIVPLVVVAGVMAYTLSRQIRASYLWITSPSGKTTRRIRAYVALRIIRKRGWYLTDVLPKTHRRQITRFEALKVAILGGKG